MSSKPPVQLPQTDDPYVLLDVRPGASADQIRRAYLRRVKVFKPDRHPAEFRRVREAYDRLREQEAWFDAWRQAGEVVRQAAEEAAAREGEEATAPDGDGGQAHSDATTVRDGDREDADDEATAREVDEDARAHDGDAGPGSDRAAASGVGDTRAPSRADASEPAPWPEPIELWAQRVERETDAREAHRRRVEQSVTAQARLEDLAEAVQADLLAGRPQAAADRLLQPDCAALAVRPTFASLLLEVCCVVVWTDPPRFAALVDRYGDLVSAHDGRHREGALLHRRTLARERAGWCEAVAAWPELERFVLLGASLRAPAEAELGLTLGRRAAAEPDAFLQVLGEAARDAPGIVALFVGMSERWTRDYGQVLPGGAPTPAAVPTVEEAAQAVVRTMQTHRAVRWQQLYPVAVVLVVATVVVTARSPLVEMLALGALVVLMGWRQWRSDPAETLYLQVVQPAAARWLWATGSSPDALAVAFEQCLPARGTWAAFVHPVDLRSYPVWMADDLALLAFGVTGPMIPVLGRRGRSVPH